MMDFKSLDLFSSCCKTLTIEIGLELGTNGPYQNKTCYIWELIIKKIWPGKTSGLWFLKMF